jgi:hypothetical protein
MTPPWLLAMALAALLTGCASPGETTPRSERWYETVVEPLHSDTDRALGFYDRIIRLKGPELAQEYEMARQAFDKNRTELNRVELSMILSLPGTGFRDEQAAMGLLQPFLKDKALEESPLRPLALLMYSHMAELRRADEALQQQGARAKEEQKRAETLQQKLDALLEMEKKLIEREQTIPPKKK